MENNRDRMIQNGRRIMYVVIAILFIKNILLTLLFFEKPLPLIIVFLFLVVSGSAQEQRYSANRARKQYIFGFSASLLLGIFNLLMLWDRFSMLKWIVYFLFYICDVGLLFIIAFNKSVKEYYIFKQFEKDKTQGTQGSMDSNTAAQLDNKNKKPCPICNEQISNEHSFCKYCGCNVAEKEEENNKLLREKFEKDGLTALLDNEKTMSYAKSYLRLYGKVTCITFLKDTAKEMGIVDIEIPEDELDILLSTSTKRQTEV